MFKNNNRIYLSILEKKTFRDIRPLIDRYVWQLKIVDCFKEVFKIMDWDDFTNIWYVKDSRVNYKCNYRSLNYGMWLFNVIRKIKNTTTIAETLYNVNVKKVYLPEHYKYSSTIEARID